MAEFEVPEKPESHKERIVGLIIAAIAVVLAVVSALGHQTQNEEILAHVDGADQYAYFQAKKERGFALGLSADSIKLNLDRLSPAGREQAARVLAGYAQEQAKLDQDGGKIQATGKGYMDKAQLLSQKSRVLDLGEIALQISIVLCSITILTEQRLFVMMGVVTAGVGIAVSLWGILLG
jgi:hypothetical protein